MNTTLIICCALSYQTSLQEKNYGRHADEQSGLSNSRVPLVKCALTEATSDTTSTESRFSSTLFRPLQNTTR